MKNVFGLMVVFSTLVAGSLAQADNYIIKCAELQNPGNYVAVKVDVDAFAWDPQISPSVNSSIKIYENNKLQFGVDDVQIARTMGVDPQEGRIFKIKSRLYSLMHHTVNDLKTGKAYENFNPGGIEMGFDSQSRTWNLNVSSGDLNITTDGQTSNAACSVTRKVSHLYWTSRYASIYVWQENDQYAMNNPWEKIDFASKK